MRNHRRTPQALVTHKAKMARKAAARANPRTRPWWGWAPLINVPHVGEKQRAKERAKAAATT